MAQAVKPLVVAMLLLFSMILAEGRGCGQSCSFNDDCDGQLYCGSGKCKDDPDVGTHICSGSGTPPASGGSSPPVSQGTSAILTVNDFSKGGDGGGPSECDGSYHANTERIVALSTRWYAGGSRCGKFITISARGMTTKAKVVDECDSKHGCRNNIVDGSNAVWEALGVSKSNPDYGEMQITWRD